MSETIIAVISTLLGTILGWVLAQLMFGKVNITLSDFEEIPQ